MARFNRKLWVFALSISLFVFSLFFGEGTKSFSGNGDNYVCTKADAAIATTLPSDMPVVFLDPQNACANPGDTVTVAIKVFNLTNTHHIAGPSPPPPDIWEWGEPLPPRDPSGRYNYSLGNLYGLKIQFSWDSAVLEYVSHTAKIPVETYSDGVLHETTRIYVDSVDTDAGDYMISAYTLAGAAFNKPNANATVFEMTFDVAKIGRSHLNITGSDLFIGYGLPQYQDFFHAIPHMVRNGQFQTEVLVGRVSSLKVESFDNGLVFGSPIIFGESVWLRTTIVNDGFITDSYNLTLYWGRTFLSSWLNETLDGGEQKTFIYTIDEAELSIGNYSITANTSMSSDGGILTDKITKQFRVIGTPQLSIIGPATAILGGTVDFSSISNHTDPYGEIQFHTWTLTAPGESHPRASWNGENVTFNLDEGWTEGNYTVALKIKDNYGIEYDGDRPATASWQTTIEMQVRKPEHIYIRADGSVDPSTAPISTTDNSTYIFTGNINGSIVVERDNIVIDGRGYTVESLCMHAWTGIDLSYRNNVTLTNGEVTDFAIGINLKYCRNSILTDNTASNNSCGIRLYNSNNNTLSSNTASNNSYYGIILPDSSNNTLTANTASNNSYYGICLFSYLFGSNNKLISNTASNNQIGIYLSGSSSNTLVGNIASNNLKGIYLYDSNNSKLTGNTALNNQIGIYLWNSNNNTLTDNTASDNSYNFGVEGTFLLYINYVDTSNTVDGKPIYYLMDEYDVIIDGQTNAGTIYLINCNNITIRDLTLTQNSAGVFLWNTTNSKIENVTALNNRIGIHLGHSSNNTLASNNVSNNEYGIWLDYSSYNRLVGNTASNNHYGIIMYRSSNNVIFHNNFIDNTLLQATATYGYVNMWDNGCEGNYWSNYAGTDLDDDGIGDSNIPWEGVDSRPLMNPYWSPSDINHDSAVNILDVNLATAAYYSTPSDPEWNPHCDLSEPYGFINIYDVVMICINYEKEYTS